VLNDASRVLAPLNLGDPNSDRIGNINPVFVARLRWTLWERHTKWARSDPSETSHPESLIQEPIESGRALNFLSLHAGFALSPVHS
jgi:hypothetical protein